MKRILPYFVYLANVALVYLVALALDFDLFASHHRDGLYVYLFLALLLYGAENWLIDRIRVRS